MNLTQLQEKRGELLTQARAALTEINANTDDNRAAELEARHDTIMGELDTLDTKIAREERLAKIEREHEERMRNRREDRRPNGDGEGRGDDGDDQENALTYRMVFAKALCGSLDMMTAEERSLLLRGYDKAAGKEFRIQTGGSTTAGGYTVPTELMKELVKSMALAGPMYDPGITTEMVTTGGNPLKIPTVDDTAKSGGAHTEGTALTDDGSEDVVFGQKSLDAYAFDTEFLKWSWELEADSILVMEQVLGELLGERLGRVANTQLTTGTGSSAPNGIVTAAATGKTAALTTAFVPEELIDLQHSVDVLHRNGPKCRFMMHDLVLAFIRKLKDGNGQFIWTMGDITMGIPDRILGYKYSVNNAMDSAFTTGKKLVTFGDFGKYRVRKVGAPVIGVLRERFWPDNGIAGLIRFDGELMDTAAVKKLVLA
jgi:HK97 family phage major capsid protein